MTEMEAAELVLKGGEFQVCYVCHGSRSDVLEGWQVHDV